MFRAIRERWSSARGRRLAGLFAFEFVVVVLGVLTAQAVQNWAKDREEDRVAGEELRRLTANYYDTRESAEIWRKANPCLREGVTAVMRAAAGQQDLDPRYLQRPRLFHTDYPNTTPDVWLRIRAKIGARGALALNDAHSRAESMRDYQRSIVTAWERFKLLDPAYGAVTARDRAEVRMTGIDVLLALRNVDIAIVNLDELAPTQKLSDPEPFDPAVDGSPMRSCPEIWQKGRIHHDPQVD